MKDLLCGKQSPFAEATKGNPLRAKGHASPAKHGTREAEWRAAPDEDENYVYAIAL